jgi:hypothetical protein
MVKQFLIENICKERISSLKRKFGKIWQKQEKRKFQISDGVGFFAKKKWEKLKFGGKERGDHGIEWKFY